MGSPYYVAPNGSDLPTLPGRRLHSAKPDALCAVEDPESGSETTAAGTPTSAARRVRRKSTVLDGESVRRKSTVLDGEGVRVASPRPIKTSPMTARPRPASASPPARSQSPSQLPVSLPKHVGNKWGTKVRVAAAVEEAAVRDRKAKSPPDRRSKSPDRRSKSPDRRSKSPPPHKRPEGEPPGDKRAEPGNKRSEPEGGKTRGQEDKRSSSASKSRSGSVSVQVPSTPPLGPRGAGMHRKGGIPPPPPRPGRPAYAQPRSP